MTSDRTTKCPRCGSENSISVDLVHEIAGCTICGKTFFVKKEFPNLPGRLTAEEIAERAK